MFRRNSERNSRNATCIAIRQRLLLRKPPQSLSETTLNIRSNTSFLNIDVLLVAGML
jgi:hypothetical protein